MAQALPEKLEHTGAAEKKRSGLSATEKAVGKYARATFAKRERNRAICLKHQIIRRAFSVREVKRTAAEEKEMNIPPEKDNERQSKK